MGKTASSHADKAISHCCSSINEKAPHIYIVAGGESDSNQLLIIYNNNYDHVLSA